MPLSLYLLTFVLVFRERALIPPRLLLALHLAAVVVALVQLAQMRHDTWFVSSAAGVAVFFTSAMVAHRTLYDARPAARYLTEFYLLMSLGGVLGGLFAALIAPRIFSGGLRVPAAAGAFRRLPAGSARAAARAAARGPMAIPDRRRRRPAAAVEAARGSEVRAGVRPVGHDRRAGRGLRGRLMLAFWRHPTRQLVLALLMFAAVVTLPSTVKRGEAQRSYFGVYRVSLSDDGEYNVLTHGTTLHGAQRVRDEHGQPSSPTPPPAPTTTPKSPMAQSIRLVREGLAERGSKGRYGVVGLGAGTLACLSEPAGAGASSRSTP